MVKVGTGASERPLDVVVEFGGFGTQYARILGRARDGVRFRARKWRRQSQSWTGVVFIMPGAIVRAAAPGDREQYAVKECA